MDISRGEEELLFKIVFKFLQANFSIPLEAKDMAYSNKPTADNTKTKEYTLSI